MGLLYEKINHHSQTKTNVYDNIKKIKTEMKSLTKQNSAIQASTPLRCDRLRDITK